MTITLANWSDRADRYRRHHWWCEICERRPPPDPTGLFDVHHCWNRGVRSPLGLEHDDELLTLCERCHDRVTTRHRAAGRRNGSLDPRTGALVDPELYAHTTWEATRLEHRRGWWRRALRRLLPLYPIDGRPR